MAKYVNAPRLDGRQFSQSHRLHHRVPQCAPSPSSASLDAAVRSASCTCAGLS